MLEIIIDNTQSYVVKTDEILYVDFYISDSVIDDIRFYIDIYFKNGKELDLQFYSKYDYEHYKNLIIKDLNIEKR